MLGNWTHPVVLTSEDHKFKWRGVDFKSGNGNYLLLYKKQINVLSFNLNAQMDSPFWFGTMNLI